MLSASAHTDTFARDNLPPPDQWPDFLLDGFDYPERINAGVELTEIETPQLLARDDIDDRQRIAGLARAVVGDHGDLAVRRHLDFVRTDAGRNGCACLAGVRIDER